MLLAVCDWRLPLVHALMSCALASFVWLAGCARYFQAHANTELLVERQRRLRQPTTFSPTHVAQDNLERTKRRAQLSVLTGRIEPAGTAAEAAAAAAAATANSPTDRHAKDVAAAKAQSKGAPACSYCNVRAVGPFLCRSSCRLVKQHGE